MERLPSRALRVYRPSRCSERTCILVMSAFCQFLASATIYTLFAGLHIHMSIA